MVCVCEAKWRGRERHAGQRGRRLKIANLHISSNLFDNPVIDALESTVRMAAVVAGIIGLLLVISIGRIKGRSASQ